MNRNILLIIAITLSLTSIVISIITFMQFRDSQNQSATLISLGSLLESKIEKGRYYTVYGYLSEGKSGLSLYPNKKISEYNSFHSAWMGAIVWYDKELVNSKCLNREVVINGKAVSYLGALGFDEIVQITDFESNVECAKTRKPVRYFETQINNKT
ncbi:MAG: hypothetical protein V7717_09680 [Porticoccaceae bacterium]